MIPRAVKIGADERLKRRTGRVVGQAKKQQRLKDQRLKEQQAATQARLRDRRLTARKYQNVVTLLSRSTKDGKKLERQVAFSRLGRKMKEKLASKEVSGRMERLKEHRRGFLDSRRIKRPTKMFSVAWLRREKHELLQQLVELTLPIDSAGIGEGQKLESSHSDTRSDDETAVSWSDGWPKWWQLPEKRNGFD